MATDEQVLAALRRVLPAAGLPAELAPDIVTLVRAAERACDQPPVVIPPLEWTPLFN